MSAARWREHDGLHEAVIGGWRVFAHVVATPGHLANGHVDVFPAVGGGDVVRVRVDADVATVALVKAIGEAVAALLQGGGR